jgi:hypothetical protein
LERWWRKWGDPKKMSKNRMCPGIFKGNLGKFYWIGSKGLQEYVGISC